MRFRATSLHGSLVLAVLASGPAIGCGREAIATTDALPVQRVVVYRNGVAYFERSGHVDRDEVRFKMKRSEVGDFLATLAVMERGGSSVRAAAFPIKVNDDDDSTEPACSDASPAPVPPKPRELTEDEKKGLETVVLSLDGRKHDLQVGYVAESPVWKPSYRLVVGSNGDADLQAWGIVENLSGEDWKNVKLSLIAGAPLAFQAQLGVPVIPIRPMVTDEGEVIAAVPHGETSLQQESKSQPVSPSGAADEGTEAADKPASRARRASPTGGRQMAFKSVERPSAPPAAAPAAVSGLMRSEGAPSESEADLGNPEPAAISAPRSLRSLAAVAVEGGATRYDLPLPVTIPDRSATMVMLLSRRVSGEALFLFAPDSGVADSASHPFRVARFTNSGGGALERGPIAVFEQGAFLGQGMVDPLPPGATATVPFALERSIAIDQDRKADEVGARVAKIQNSTLAIERDRVLQTKYRVRNGSDTQAKLLVKHPRLVGARLFEPPKGTDDNVGTGSALVPILIAAHSTTQLVVDERTTARELVDWFSIIADDAVRAFIADARSDREVVRKLSAAWDLRRDIVKKRAERDKLEVETGKLAQGTEETRRNLRAIERNKTAEAVSQKLTARLAEAAARLDELNRKTVELDSQLAELGVRWSEALRDIELVVPATAGGP
jgi:Domain of unknown function (DUF4139)